MSGFSRKLVEVTLVVVAAAIFGPVAVDACEFGAEVPQAIQEATCSITIRASGNAEAATFRWEVTREAAAMIGMVSAAEDGAVASEAFRAETRDIPYEVALGVVESLEEVMELLWAIHGDRFEEPEFLFPGLLVYYGSENIASAWLSPDDGEAAMLFYTNPLLRMRASDRDDAGGSTDARWVLRESEGNLYATVQGSNLLLSVSCVAVGDDPGHAIGILLLAGTFGDGTVDFLFDGEVLRENVAFERTEPNVLMAWSARGAARAYNPAVEGLVDLIRRHSTVRVTVSTASGAGFTWDDLSLTGSNTAIDLMACGS